MIGRHDALGLYLPLSTLMSMKLRLQCTDRPGRPGRRGRRDRPNEILRVYNAPTDATDGDSIICRIVSANTWNSLRVPRVAGHVIVRTRMDFAVKQAASHRRDRLNSTAVELSKSHSHSGQRTSRPGRPGRSVQSVHCKSHFIARVIFERLRSRRRRWRKPFNRNRKA
jgi:hypothetical protein